MNLLDIIGPVMVGPSSSHTAGAVKIGRVCHKLLAEKVVRADIYFHGSFLAHFLYFLAHSNAVPKRISSP